MLLKRTFIITASVLIITTSCNSEPQGNEKNKEVKHANTPGEQPKRTQLKANGDPIVVKGDLKLYPAKIAQKFPDAELYLSKPSIHEKLNAGNINFEFEVKNYELRQQTKGAEERHCANSKDGQHIHFIVNNGAYEAKYTPSFEAELMEGNNVILAFLSRSYHEGIKNGRAYVIHNFPVGDHPDDFDPNAPHLFYSRPKGVYSAADAERILVDFYLLNTELSPEGNKIALTIDEEEFILDSWQPYFVEGLTVGEHQFRIRLIDKNGEIVSGPFNDSGGRTIEISNGRT